MPDPVIAPVVVDPAAAPPVVAPAVPPVVVPPVVAPAATWFDGASDEIKGQIINRGWNTKTPAEVALEAIAAHRQAEKFIGAPADQLLRRPDPADEASTKAFWSKLGTPETADKYDFSAVKTADGAAAPAELIEAFRASAFAGNLPQDQAVRLAQDVTKFLEGITNGGVESRTAARAESEKQLQANWGANAVANKVIADGAAARLGLSQAALDAALNADYASTMEALRKVGAAIGEDKFISNANPAIPGVMTREQAVARRAELERDTAWVERYQKGDQAANRELQALIKVITGDAEEPRPF